ncbi:MAG: sensor N-terminal transmembrane domain-containing protein, partial [Acetobacter orientalis]
MTSRTRMLVSSSLSRLKGLRLPGLGEKGPEQDTPPTQDAPRRRRVSPLMRRIMLVNVLPLALLAVTMLFLNQFRNSLLATEVTALREQARIYAGALGESAVRSGRSHTLTPDGEYVLEAAHASRLLLRLTEPSPNAHARLFGPDGQLIADNLADLPGHPTPHRFSPSRQDPRRPPPFMGA